MKKMKRLIAALLAGVMVLAMLTACSTGIPESELEKAIQDVYMAKMNEAFGTENLENDASIKAAARTYLEAHAGDTIGKNDVMLVKYDNAEQTQFTTVLICYDVNSLADGAYKKTAYEASNAGNLVADASSIADLLLTKVLVDLGGIGKATAIGVATQTDKETGKTYVAIGYTYTLDSQKTEK